MKKVMLLTAIAGAALLLTGCGSRGQKVLARVNGEVITLKEFNEKIEMLPENYREMARNQKKEFLDEIIKEKLLYEDALKSKLDKDQEAQKVIAAAKRQILIASLLKTKIEDRLSVSEEDIKKYYDEHSEEFMLPERWRAAHILVDTEAEAEDVRKKLEEGADFGKLAGEKSKDPTSKKGGDIGYFSKGQIVPEFEEACLELEVGGISRPVKTQFGYHIIMLTEKKSPEVQGFSSVEDIIKKELERELKVKLFEKLMADLRDNAKITINEELIADAPAKDISEAEE